MKRLVVCCDGTWQDLEAGYPTNVVKITQAIKHFDDDSIQQVVYYDEGIGAESNISPEEDLTFLGAGHREQLLESIKGGAFGKGIDKNIRDAYSFLCLNYAQGDEIYLFGFSRGAYTVRSLAGMLYYCGLIKRPHIRKVPEAYELYRAKLAPHDPKIAQFRQDYCYQNSEYKYQDRVPITLLGCWDTVGSLGLPDALPHIPIDKLINRDRYKFHDTTLSPIVENAIHAVAIDETRKSFAVTLMEKSPEAESQNLKQAWFPGDHGCVGGGTATQSKLADSALLWMMQAVDEVGLDLKFDQDSIPESEKIDPDPTADYGEKPKLKVLSRLTRGKLTGNIRGDLTKVGTYIRPIPETDEIHSTVGERWHKRDDYRPSNLDPGRVPSKS
ncbi:MAG: DUF2235 domain-containing protein [Cyanobacteria bacterium P01_G01_bin.39]